MLPFIRLISTPASIFPVLASLGIVSFLWFLSFSHDKNILITTVGPFLLILCTSFVVLSQIQTYHREKTSGVLLFLIGNAIALHVYVRRIFVWNAIFLITPLTFLGVLFYSFCMQEIVLSHYLAIGISLYISMLTTLLFTHLLSAFSLSRKISPLFSLFLIWPFLIPTLILSLTTFQALTLYESIDTICLNLGFFLLTCGLVYSFVPRLLKTIFDDSCAL